jgi:hypothetical protein
MIIKLIYYGGRMGKGLFKLYMAFWLLWFSYGVLDNYKELAIYVGYNNWTSEKDVEKNKASCDTNQQSDNCLSEKLKDTQEAISEDSVNVIVWMFTMAMIKAPFYFLLFLILIYWLGSWVFSRLRAK